MLFSTNEMITSIAIVYIISSVYYFLIQYWSEDNTTILLHNFPNLLEKYKKNKSAPLKQFGMLFVGLCLFIICFRPFRDHIK